MKEKKKWKNGKRKERYKLNWFDLVAYFKNPYYEIGL